MHPPSPAPLFNNKGDLCPPCFEYCILDTDLFVNENIYSVIPIIERERCTLCGHCEDFCLSGVFRMDKAEKCVDIDHEKKCWGCGDCVGWCPEEAMMLIDKETKEVVWDNRGLARPYRPEKWKK